jgi:hypothetical protein
VRVRVWLSVAFERHGWMHAFVFLSGNATEFNLNFCFLMGSMVGHVCSSSAALYLVAGRGIMDKTMRS